MNTVKNLFRKPFFVILFLVIIGSIFGTVIKLASPSATNAEFIIVEKSNLIQEVSVTGRVEPAKSVDLAFEKSGRVAWVGAGVGERVFAGQTLVRLTNADLTAQIAQAEANVKAEQARLDELKKGTRPEEVQVQRTKVENAKKDLVETIKDAFTKSDDAIRNKADQFISNPQGTTPDLNISVEQQTETQVENGRVIIEKTLNDWALSLVALSTASDLNFYVEEAKINLSKVKSFLDDAARALSLASSSTGISQTTLDGYRSSVSTARTNINTAIAAVITDNSTLAFEQNQLTLKEAGTTPEQILAQEAKVESVSANVDNLRAQIAKTIISSPIGGVVTKQEAKVGEIIAASSVVVSVISSADFEITANIPEVDIAKVEVGDEADMWLDAYGNEEKFAAVVVEINPAETIIEGVSTYKITLQFTKKDERVRSGMTANIDILTASRQDVISVPQRAVITKNSGKIVRVLNDDNTITEMLVKTGLKGSDGSIEITEGIEEGMKVVVFLSKK